MYTYVYFVIFYTFLPFAKLVVATSSRIQQEMGHALVVGMELQLQPMGAPLACVLLDMKALFHHVLVFSVFIFNLECV